MSEQRTLQGREEWKRRRRPLRVTVVKNPSARGDVGASCDPSCYIRSTESPTVNCQLFIRWAKLPPSPHPRKSAYLKAPTTTGRKRELLVALAADYMSKPSMKQDRDLRDRQYGDGLAIWFALGCIFEESSAGGG